MAADVAAIVSDGDEENESILVIETNGALKAEETVLTAIDIINSKIKNFHHVSSFARVVKEGLGTFICGLKIDS